MPDDSFNQRAPLEKYLLVLVVHRVDVVVEEKLVTEVHRV